jgi:hypothetical protein
LPAADFHKQGIGYAMCPQCGHLNGIYEDTAEYCAALYARHGGAGYAKTYTPGTEAEYAARVRQVYVPKAEFLLDVLRTPGEEAANLRYADLGAGSGYFMAALRTCGVERVTGFEVSRCQVETANRMLGGPFVVRHDMDALQGIVQGLDAEVVSMIGVLEHLRRPRETLAALCANRAVKYLFLSVPLFSPCVFLEMVFPDVMQRHLAGGHTHLFTESSLDWTFREHGLQILGEWWFGVDAMDWLRSVEIRLERDEATARMAGRWRELMTPAMDGLQEQLDRRRMSSEVHLVLEVRR